MISFSEQKFNNFFYNIPLESKRNKSEDAFKREKTDIFTSFLEKNKDELIRLLSIINYYSVVLGNASEDRFIIPTKMDNTIKKCFPNIECVNGKSYDIVFNSNTLISNKTQRYIFHTKTNKVRPSEKTEHIILFNTYGARGKRKVFPVFDCLLIFQYIPFLSCATISHPNVYKYFSDTGNIKPIPFSDLTFVISPYTMLPPSPITKEHEDLIIKEIKETKESEVMFNYIKGNHIENKS